MRSRTLAWEHADESRIPELVRATRTAGAWQCPSATINPARFAGLENEVGRVATGYAADLVLLDANPLQDIRNTSRINAVALRGQRLDRAALDRMLAKAKER